MDFDISVDNSSTICIVKVYGIVDISATPRLDACLSEAVNFGKTDIAIDFENCSYIDSECVKVLFKTYRIIRDKGRMIICGAHGPVLRVFQILGMNALFKIIPSIECL